MQSKVGFSISKLNFSISSSKAFLSGGSFLTELSKVCFEFNFARSINLLPPFGALVKMRTSKLKVELSAS